MIEHKYYGFRADPRVIEPMLSSLKRRFKRRSVSDLIYFLISDAYEKNLLTMPPNGSMNLRKEVKHDH